MKKITLVVFLPLIILAKPVYIDEILTQSNSFRLDMSVSYSNMQRSNGVSSPFIYQTQNGDFVSVPTYLGESSSNQDYLNYAITLRYGVTKDLELFTSVNLYSSKTHSNLGNHFDKDSTNGFNALSLGLVYQIKAEDDTPSLLLGFSNNALERTQFGTGTLTSHFKGYRVFATSFYTVDPVVFLLSTSYGVNLKKEFKEDSIEIGNILTISPQVYFAVNPYTSLNWGVKYTHFDEGEVNGEQVSNSGSNVSFLMGLSYEFSAKTIFNVNTEYLNSNDVAQSTISTSFSYKF